MLSSLPAIQTNVTYFPSQSQFHQLIISSKYQEIFLFLKYSTLATKDVAPAEKKNKAQEARFLIHINCIRKHTFFTQDSHSLLNQ